MTEVNLYPLTNWDFINGIKQNHNLALYAITPDPDAKNPFIEKTTEYIGMTTTSVYDRLDSHKKAYQSVDYEYDSNNFKSKAFQENSSNRYFTFIELDDSFSENDLLALESLILRNFMISYNEPPICNKEIKFINSSNEKLMDLYKNILNNNVKYKSLIYIQSPKLNFTKNDIFDYVKYGVVLQPNSNIKINDSLKITFNKDNDDNNKNCTPALERFKKFISPYLIEKENGFIEINKSNEGVSKNRHNFKNPKFTINTKKFDFERAMNPPYGGLFVNPEDIYIDTIAQRDPNPEFVKFLVANFTWAGIGCISLHMNSDGNLVCIDGQHRVLTALTIKTLYNIDILLPCIIHSFDKENYKDKLVASFLSSNTTRPLSISEQHKPLVEFGEERAVGIQNIFDKNGWILETQNKKNKNIGSKACKVYRLESLHYAWDFIKNKNSKIEILNWASDNYSKWFYNGYRPDTSIDTDIIKNLSILMENYKNIHNFDVKNYEKIDKILDLLLNNGYYILQKTKNDKEIVIKMNTPNKLQKGLAEIAKRIYVGNTTKFGVSQLISDIMTLYFDHGDQDKINKVSSNHRNIHFSVAYDIYSIKSFLKGIFKDDNKNNNVSYNIFINHNEEDVEEE